MPNPKNNRAHRYQRLRLLTPADIQKKPSASPADTFKAATKTKGKKADSGTAAVASKKRKITETETSANDHEDQDYAATPAKKKQVVEEERRVKFEVERSF
ncbi:MAG: hypothetical protein LQ344_000777 [Seirophora lacunosa]|nr:MAG: hypothetical protein LQ344_000777 [Seirophora lacunosa]